MGGSPSGGRWSRSPSHGRHRQGGVTVGAAKGTSTSKWRCSVGLEVGCVIYVRRRRRGTRSQSGVSVNDERNRPLSHRASLNKLEALVLSATSRTTAKGDDASVVKTFPPCQPGKTTTLRGQISLAGRAVPPCRSIRQRDTSDDVRHPATPCATLPSGPTGRLCECEGPGSAMFI